MGSDAVTESSFAGIEWSAEQKLTSDDFKRLMPFALAKDREDFIRDFIERVDVVKDWLSVQTLRELYSRVPKISMFGRLLKEERRAKTPAILARLQGPVEKAVTTATDLGIKWPFSFVSPEFENLEHLARKVLAFAFNRTASGELSRALCLK